jgi:trans-AT polyketide synthase, acyltransferase and oxidoreductase domains
VTITADTLGSAGLRNDYRLRYAYMAGSMYKGIASANLVTEMAKAGFMAYLGTGGLTPAEIHSALQSIRLHLENQNYGANVLCNLDNPAAEDGCVDVLIENQVRHVEASAFMRITPSLVRYRLRGLSLDRSGALRVQHRILAKVSRPEVARVFMQPAPESMVRALLSAGRISAEEARLSDYLPMAGEICIEADSGGHTDRGVALALLPAAVALRNEMQKKHAYMQPIRIGAAGGIGTPHAAAAAFVLGAEFILTGSINQCTVEAGTSESVKDLLQELDGQDTAYAPAGDMFELGAKVQVVKRGLFFPARANKLYELYQRHDSLEEIDEKTQQQIQEKYFKRSFDEIWEETKAYYARIGSAKLAAIERNPKQKMALIFKWYFVQSTRYAMRGHADYKVDYQIHCGPAMGSFNQWVRNTEIENWRSRHVADIAKRLMNGAAIVLQDSLGSAAGQETSIILPHAASVAERIDKGVNGRHEALA